MKKYLVLSDIHHNSSDLNQLISLYEKSIDGVLFAGDGLNHINILKKHFPVFAVRGNSDKELLYPLELEVILDKAKIFITHGHFFKVKSGLSSLMQNLKHRQYDLIVYGHTHIPASQQYDNTQVVNPGAFTNGHYAVLYIEGNDCYFDFEKLS